MGTTTSPTAGICAGTLTYHVTALSIPIYFNKYGDRDCDGMMFALTANVPILKHIRALAKVSAPGKPADCSDTPGESPNQWKQAAEARAAEIGVALPSTPEEARKPHPLVRPLVLRARRGDTVRGWSFKTKFTTSTGITTTRTASACTW